MIFFELFTDKEPYGVNINLKTDTETKNLYVGEENRQQFQNNAVIMFSLIGNVEYISFTLDDGLEPYSIRYTREWRIINGVRMCAILPKARRNSAS